MTPPKIREAEVMKWFVFFFGMAAGMTRTEGARALWDHEFPYSLVGALTFLVITAFTLGIEIDTENKYPG
jgi:hypothetical protein